MFPFKNIYDKYYLISTYHSDPYVRELQQLSDDQLLQKITELNKYVHISGTINSQNKSMDNVNKVRAAFLFKKIGPILQKIDI